MTFGEKVAILRKEKGYSQEQLGAQLHLSKQAVQKWESGAGMPDISVIMPLAKILGTSADILLDNEKEIERKEEAPAPTVERKRISYEELEKRKTTPFKILLIVTISLLALGTIVLAAIHNMVGWILGPTLLVLGFTIAIFIIFPFMINLKRYTYNGHEIICYAGANQHYLIIDGYVHDFLEAEGIIKDRYLKGTVDGKEVVMTLTWSNNISLKIDGVSVFPDKKKREKN